MVCQGQPWLRSVRPRRRFGRRRWCGALDRREPRGRHRFLAFYSPSTDQWTDAGWQYDETEHFFAMTAQLNWLIPNDSALSLLAGTGAIVASVAWEETITLITDPTITS